MSIEPYIINDVKIQAVSESVENLKAFFNEMTYSHIPVEEHQTYIGCIAENDVRCFENEKTLKDYQYALEPFFVRQKDNWLDVLGAFAKNNTNLMPVLDEDSNKYIGYVELNDIMAIFNETPFLSEAGGILVVEKGFTDYSFSEISQIIESNDGKILGFFISKIEHDIAQVTIKINLSSINEIIQTFRRYGYKIVSTHQEDVFLKNLKERSDYLDKYLNI